MQETSTDLPIQLTSFVGREREIAEVKRLLATARLLTLTGSGGAGKTRLALQVASDFLPDSSAQAEQSFSDGIWLVELAAYADPTLVPQAVASVFGIQAGDSPSLSDVLASYLRSKEMLLLLDNCEHLIDACARLADKLLHACPHLRLLATSREALNVAGEMTYRVPSLALPDPYNSHSLETLAQFESIQLFTERAAMVRPEFKLTQSNFQAVAQICQQLDGMPLAIELAAARVKALGIEQIAARLDDRFSLLTNGHRTALPRQQTLRATIDWSYDLLPEAERRLFRQLSVFAGGWTLETAEVVCSGDGVAVSDVLDLLSRLIDRSLVIIEEQGSGVRYRFLETIRQYAQEKLKESSETEKWRARHLKYFLELAEEAEPQLKAAAQRQWFNRLEAELDNFRAALRSALESDQTEAGLRLAAALEHFWHLHGYVREGLEWLKRALAQSTPAPAAARAKALMRASFLLRTHRADAEAIALAEEGLALYRELGDKLGIATALSALGTVSHFRGDEDQALVLLAESLSIFRSVGDQWRTAMTLLWLADIRMRQEDYAQAAPLWEESLSLFRTLGDNFGIAFALGGTGDLARHQGDYVRATALLVESLSLFWELGNKANIPFSLEALSILAVLREDPVHAARLWGVAEALRESIDSHVPPSYRTAYALYLAAARTRLGENVFESARAEGRTLTLEMAIIEARQLGIPKATRQAIIVPEPSHCPVGLTAREVDVLHLLAKGLNNQQIADQLVLSRRTVHAHVRSIFRKLAVNTRSAATRIALEQKIV